MTGHNLDILLLEIQRSPLSKNQGQDLVSRLLPILHHKYLIIWEHLDLFLIFYCPTVVSFLLSRIFHLIVVDFFLTHQNYREDFSHHHHRHKLPSLIKGFLDLICIAGIGNNFSKCIC